MKDICGFAGLPFHARHTAPFSSNFAKNQIDKAAGLRTLYLVD
jgi:hypothetical protein